MSQLELFGVTPNKPERRVTPNGSTSPKWRKYNQRSAKRPHQCDYCVLNCRDDPSAPIPRRARYIRKTHDSEWYLCLAHANDQRIVDGLKVFRGAT